MAKKTVKRSKRSSSTLRVSGFLNHLEKNPLLSTTLILFMLIRITLSIYYKEIWWDPAVYIGMGKYIYSSGAIGLWEPLRPLVLSLIIGFFWKIGMNAIIIGKTIEILASFGCVFLTYVIGKEIFDKRTGILAAFFMALTPTFLFFGSMILTGIPSLFFSLLAIYLFLKKRYYFSGLCFGISFLLRFPQGIMVVLAFLVLTLVCFKGKIKNIKNKSALHGYFMNSLYLGLGFLTLVAPYLVFNKIYYGGFLYSILEGAKIISHVNVTMRASAFYYLYNILFENIFVVFSLAGIYFVIRKRVYTAWLMLLPFAFFFVYFCLQGHKEMRYFIILFPYLYILASYGIFSILNYLKHTKKSKNRIRVFFIVLVIITSFSSFSVLSANLYGYSLTKSSSVADFYSLLKDTEESALVSSPIPVAYSDIKPEIIYWTHKGMYNDYFASKNVNYALINHCDLYCPEYDGECKEARDEFVQTLKTNDELIKNEKMGACEYFLFKKKIKGEVDTHSGSIDFSYVLDVGGFDKEQYLENMTALLDSDLSDFAKGDITLVIGRITNNDEMICESTNYYLSHKPLNKEEEALIYETLASIGCNESRKNNLLKASRLWLDLGNEFRGKLDWFLAYNLTPKFEYELSEPTSSDASHPEYSEVIIGNSSLNLDSSDILVSQTDRVTRDWLSYQLYKPFNTKLLTVFSERLTYDDSDLRPDIGWHEGGRIKMMEKSGFEHIVASGTITKKINDKWYAPNEEGVFMFQIPYDKIYYPTTRFLRDDIAVVIDTHGINMLVEQSIRKNASAVMGCCDHPGKIKAALYLSSKGISTICFTDRFSYLALNKESNIITSAPFLVDENTASLGKRPVRIMKGTTLVALNSSGEAQMYYDTPASYFKELSRHISLDVNYVTITENNILPLIEEAREVDASIIGARVFNLEDYNHIKSWLEEDNENIAVLFHTVSYPYGFVLFQEFPEQTTFGDVNPIFLA